MAASLTVPGFGFLRCLSAVNLQRKACIALSQCIPLQNRIPQIVCCRRFFRQHSWYSSKATAVQMSDRCIQRLKDILSEKEKYLRILVDGGGCSGFQYVFSLDSKVNPDDSVIEKDGVGIVIDKMSLEFMQGATIDYSEELIRSSFRVLNNPKAEKGCSCGASFNVKGI